MVSTITKEVSPTTLYGACCNKTRQSEHWYYQEFQGSKFSNVIIKIPHLLYLFFLNIKWYIELPLYKNS